MGHSHTQSLSHLREEIEDQGLTTSRWQARTQTSQIGVIHDVPCPLRQCLGCSLPGDPESGTPSYSSRESKCPWNTLEQCSWSCAMQGPAPAFPQCSRKVPQYSQGGRNQPRTALVNGQAPLHLDLDVGERESVQVVALRADIRAPPFPLLTLAFSKRSGVQARGLSPSGQGYWTVGTPRSLGRKADLCFPYLLPSGRCYSTI